MFIIKKKHYFYNNYHIHLFWFIVWDSTKMQIEFFDYWAKTKDSSIHYVTIFSTDNTRNLQWGATLNEQYEEEEGSVEEDMPEDFQHKKPRRSSSASDLGLFKFINIKSIEIRISGIINREKSDIIDAKLHETNVPEAKQTTVSVLVDDTLDFITVS